MQGNLFTISYHTAGAAAANHKFIFTLPCPATLIGVSASGSNANNGILDIGPSTDTDGAVSNMDVGDSDTPNSYDSKEDFEGDEYHHFAGGTIIEALLDYDGAGGTAVADFTLVLFFMEG